MLATLCEALPATGLAADADLVIVTPTAGTGCAGLPVVEDPDGSLADTYGMRSPAAGGPPVGYAVVDAQSRIRYRTLDPTVTAELSEVRTILEAL
jgi:alkyl hydroperoxide reductase subunit AhpC